MGGEGVGASLRRREDDRFLRGRGQFVGDLRFAGMKDVAFVRSPLAHASLVRIHVPDALRERVFTAADLAGVKPIVAISGLPGFKASEQPILAVTKVRQVGELLAMCLGDTRAQAEDAAAAVDVELAELPAVVDMLRAREPGSALLHEHWGDNVFLETFVDINMEAALDAPIKITREISTARQSMAPMEGRGVVALWDTRQEQLVLHHRHPDAAYRAQRAGGMPRPRSRAQVRASFRQTSAAASATRASCCPRRCAPAGSPCAAAARCAGSRTGAST